MELKTAGGIRFALVSGMIEIYFGAQCVTALEASQGVTHDEFVIRVDDWLCDNLDELDSYWEYAFQATVKEGMS